MKIAVKLKDKISLTQKIINRIRDALINGDLKAGEKLPPEIKLAESFGVSRTAIREAFKMLVALGVAVVKQGNGTYISKNISSTVIDPLIFSLILEDRTPQELLELREMIEIGLLEIVLNKVTDEDIEKMKKAIDELEQSYQRGETDLKILTKLDLKFHYAFADTSHNPSIEKIARTIWEVFTVSIKRSARFERATIHHRRILQAIKERNRKKAREAIRVSLRVWKRHQAEGLEKNRSHSNRG